MSTLQTTLLFMTLIGIVSCKEDSLAPAPIYNSVEKEDQTIPEFYFGSLALHLECEGFPRSDHHDVPGYEFGLMTRATDRFRNPAHAYLFNGVNN